MNDRFVLNDLGVDNSEVDPALTSESEVVSLRTDLRGHGFHAQRPRNRYSEVNSEDVDNDLGESVRVYKTRRTPRSDSELEIPTPNGKGKFMAALFTCANTRCQRDLGVDHVTLVTTAHVRRFCSVECITDGQQAHYDSIARAAGLRVPAGSPSSPPIEQRYGCTLEVVDLAVDLYLRDRDDAEDAYSG